MKNTLLSTCCQAPAKVDQSGEGTGFFWCTKCVKGCDVTMERTGFGSKPSTLKAKRKPTGELKTLDRMISQRGPYSEISGEPLVGPDHDKYHFQIFHVLPKGEYPELRLLEENLILSTWQEQVAWTGQRHTLKGLPEWQMVFDREAAMKLAVRIADRSKASGISD